MKKNFVILSLIATMALPAGAELTVNDTVSTDYLKHHEHSDSTVYAAQKLRAMANGETYKEEPAETFDEYYDKPVLKQVRRFLMYLDPGLDDHTFLNGHSTSPTTRYTDW